MLTSRHINLKQQGDTLTKEEKSRQAKNFFREITTDLKSDGAYSIGHGRSKDIRYKFAKLRGGHLAVYIGIPKETPLYKATIDQLKEFYPHNWTYASSEMRFGNNIKGVWWVGWDYPAEEEPTIAEMQATTKHIISAIRKEERSGEIGPNH